MFVEEKKQGEPQVIEGWRQILLSAADMIEKHGWLQHAFGNDRRGFCALGAILRVTVANHTYWRSVCALREKLPIDIISWNDTKGRTKEEVVATLRAAAAL